jgi:hypothetical protein
MKNLTLKFCLLTMCIVAGMNCSKDDSNLAAPPTVSDVIYWPIRHPLSVPPAPNNDYEPGNGPHREFNFPVRSPQVFPDAPFKSDTLTNPAYLKRTCLFDFSQLEEGKIYEQINNKNLHMAFYTPEDDEYWLVVRRLKPTTPWPNGWTFVWNTPPLVEREHPEVLFADFLDTFVFLLSKPCTEFGVEISPNIQNIPYPFVMYTGNYKGDGSSGLVGHVVQTPSGARLFNIQAEKPFTVVTFSTQLSRDERLPCEGMAMANIRYRLAP